MNLSHVSAADLLDVGDSEAVHLDARAIRSSTETGQLVRVRRGMYVDTARWRGASAADRYLLRVQAVARSRARRPVFSYWSAAALWGFPRIGPWPTDVHITASPDSGSHSRYGVRYHRERLGDGDLTETNGFLVTTPGRTIIDLARSATFRDAVVVADAALNDRRTAEQGGVQKAELIECAQRCVRGAVRAARVVAFADGRAANPGETLSRLVMLESGLVAPELQTEHPNPDGGSYFTDFEWPEYAIIGEFDGRGKYLKDELLRGRSPGEIVYEEKRREDHLRAEGNTVVRWGWRELNEPGRLLALLSAAGVPYRAWRHATSRPVRSRSGSDERLLLR